MEIPLNEFIVYIMIQTVTKLDLAKDVVLTELCLTMFVQIQDELRPIVKRRP